MRRPLWLVVLLAMLLACGRGDPAPQEPVWGKQPCANCAMLLSDKAHGAQVLTADGERLFFDDPGCLIAWSIGQPTPAAQWVRTMDSHAWLTTDRAHFAPTDHTPMDFGFGATAAPGPQTWQQVTEAVQRKLQKPKE